MHWPQTSNACAQNKKLFLIDFMQSMSSCSGGMGQLRGHRVCMHLLRQQTVQFAHLRNTVAEKIKSKEEDEPGKLRNSNYMPYLWVTFFAHVHLLDACLDQKATITRAYFLPIHWRNQVAPMELTTPISPVCLASRCVSITFNITVQDLALRQAYHILSFFLWLTLCCRQFVQEK